MNVREREEEGKRREQQRCFDHYTGIIDITVTFFCLLFFFLNTLARYNEQHKLVCGDREWRQRE